VDIIRTRSADPVPAAQEGVGLKRNWPTAVCLQQTHHPSTGARWRTPNAHEQ
jgi:hypothetical protein